mmetsp:Transcript_95002/g.306741  ORF Transcript_95002/g.306741 Transcript_95002/m.306741 type:complete len:220 (+) Transcript_95002:1516-2175(+)
MTGSGVTKNSSGSHSMGIPTLSLQGAWLETAGGCASSLGQGSIRASLVPWSMQICAGVWPMAFRRCGLARAARRRVTASRRPMCAAMCSGVQLATSAASIKGRCRMSSSTTEMPPALQATCKLVEPFASQTSQQAPRCKSQRTAARLGVAEKSSRCLSKALRWPRVSSRTLPMGALPGPHSSTLMPCTLMMPLLMPCSSAISSQQQPGPVWQHIVWGQL